LRVLRSKWLSMGPEVQAFEREFAAALAVKHAFATSYATVGLHLALLATGVGRGDEVIQPALNFVASANMTMALGAVPIFADVLSLTEPTIDPAEIERLITKRTKAVIVMHYGGYCCRMTEIQAICRKRGVALIEDACHAIGAKYLDPQQRSPHGQMAGSIGDVAAFSFFSNKNLATGEGGMIVTNRDDLAAQVKLLRSHGMTTLTWDREKGHASSYDVVRHGFNDRLDELHAALGREQLKKLAAGNERRGRAVALYRRRLKNLTGWAIPFGSYAGDSAFHLMTTLAPSQAARTQVTAELKEAGIQTSLHYPCITDFAAFAQFSHARVPVTREYASSVITLPLHARLSDEAVEEVCAKLQAAAAHAR